MKKYTLKNTLNISYESRYGEISSYVYEEKKSKFMSYIFNISNKDNALKCIEMVRKENYDSKHIVYLYKIIQDKNEILKFSDDGEPQGTGTKAILEMIDKENITNILIIIVRYFGGILLGAGPLARAYLNSFKGAYKSLVKYENIEYSLTNIKIKYDNINDMEYILSNYIDNNDVIVIGKKFGNIVEISLNISKRKYDEIYNRIKLLLED